MPYVSHEHLVETRKGDYYVSLRRSQTTFKTMQETIVPWLEFFLDTCLEQAKHAEELLRAEAIEEVLSPSQLLVWQRLADVAESTPGDIAAVTGVPRRTVSQALEKLLLLGKVERLGQGRATRYRRKTVGSEGGGAMARSTNAGRAT